MLSDFIEDPEAEYKLGLSPTKEYKVDSFAESIISQLKSKISAKHQITFVSDDNYQIELQRVRRDTIKFNQTLTGKLPKSIIPLKDAWNNKQFFEKFKAFIDKNSLMEAYIEGLPIDEDKLEAMEQAGLLVQPDSQSQGTRTKEYTSSRTSPYSTLQNTHTSAFQKQPKDIDVVVAKIVQDARFHPILSILCKIMDIEQKIYKFDLIDFPITDAWTKIICESLTYNKKYKKQEAKRLTLAQNQLSSINFSKILSCFHDQKHLVNILYHDNELRDDEALERLLHFI